VILPAHIYDNLQKIALKKLGESSILKLTLKKVLKVA
jgi:hypothetical protein